MRYSDKSRRHLLVGGAATLFMVPSSLGAALQPTPPQTAGPFYPPRLPFDHDNDLVRVAGQAERAAGTILHLSGRVLGAGGRPLPGVRIEIWQCDAFGHYHHPRDRGGIADPRFQGFGRTIASAEGTYRFRTIEPVPYPGRTPHIHFRVAGDGIEGVTTQMYIQGHPLNARDGIYSRLGSRASAVTVPLTFAPELEPEIRRGAKRAHFDIVLDDDAVRAAG